MKILITGKNGFIAKNAIDFFEKRGHVIFSISHTEDDKIFEKYCKNCEIVFHFAAVQRSNNKEDFFDGNVKYTQKLINFLTTTNNIVPIIFSSSISVENNSVFAESKLKAESILKDYSKNYSGDVIIMRLNHIFGKYGKPNFNNVVSTFCFNTANNIPLVVNDPSIVLNFTHIDDLLKDINSMMQQFNGKRVIYYKPSNQFSVSIGKLVMYLGEIKRGVVFEGGFPNLLYKTYNFYEE